MVQKEQLSCPSCGKAVSTGQKFCTYCGTKFSEVLCPACGKAVKFGQKFCRSCGANIKDAIPTSNTQRISPQLEITQSDIEFLRQAIESKDKRATRDFLEKYLRQVSIYEETSRYKIYDLIGMIIKEDFEFFRCKIYSKFYEKAQYLLIPQLFLEMEEYLLEKYFFLDGEEVIASSRGKVIIDGPNREIRGRIYVTNQRIIAFGQHRWAPPESFRRVSKGHGGIEFPFKAGIRLWTTKFLDNVIPYYFNSDEFPLSKASIRIDQFERKKNRVIYTFEFEYVRRNKTKNRTDELKFELVEDPGENEIDFQKRTENFLSQINDFMNSTFSSNLKED